MLFLPVTCDKALVTLQKRAGGQKEVTAAMVIKKARVDYGEQVVRKASPESLMPNIAPSPPL